MAPYESQGAVVPPYGLVEFAQDPRGTVLGDLPGPVEDIRLQDLLDPGPVGGEGELPVGLDLGGDLREEGGRIVVQQPRPGPGVRFPAQHAEFVPYLFGGGAADGVELGAEGGERSGGGGVEEVGEVTVRGHERAEPPRSSPARSIRGRTCSAQRRWTADSDRRASSR